MSEKLSLKEKMALAKKAIAKFSKKNVGSEVSLGGKDFGKIELVKTGIWAFDRLIKGLPRGMVTHIAGPSGVGKSTLVLCIIAYLQKNKNLCAYGNNERRFSKEWAVRNGVDIDELIGGNFGDLEACLDFCIQLTETPGMCDALAIDTITALASRGELSVKAKKGKGGEVKEGKAKSTADDTMALIPRKLSQFFRMGVGKIADSGMVLILVNQVRKSLGDFKPKDIAVGGNALEHMKTLDIFFRKAARSEWPKGEDGKDIGHLVHATLLKSTHCMEARQGDTIAFNFLNGIGFDNAYDIVYHARLAGVIKSNAAAGEYSYTDNSGKEHVVKSKADGRDLNLKKYFEEAKLIDEIQEKMDKISVNTESIDVIKLDKEAEGEDEENE